MVKSKKVVIWSLVSLIALLIVAVIIRKSHDGSSPYTWDIVSRGDIRETITASGEFQAKARVNVGTSVMGEIKEIYVKDGQDVKVGDPLVTIDFIRIQQEYAQTKSALEAAKIEAERSKINSERQQETFERMENLFGHGLVSNEDLRQARQNRDMALLAVQSVSLNVDQAFASMKVMEDNLSKTKLLAPISGRVTGPIAEKGETAIPGQSNLSGATLMVISDMSEILVEVKVSESEVVRTKIGQHTQITAESFPGKVFSGKIAEVATASEKTGQGQDTNMYKVKVALDMNAPGVNELRPGMSARAVILTAEAKNVLRVPLQSVLERDGDLEESLKKGLFAPETQSVVMAVKNNIAFETVVSVGIADTQYFELLDGLLEGDKLLTGPIRKLKDLMGDSPVKLRQKSDSGMEAADMHSKEK